MYNLEPMNPFGVRLTATGNSLPQLTEVLRLLNEHFLVLVQGIPVLSEADFLSYCRSASPIEDPTLHWSFGPVMHLCSDPTKHNYLFSNERVPLHWDGAFFEVPSTLVFNCIEAPDPQTGGESVFSNTKTVVEGMDAPNIERFERLSATYETEKLAHYGGKISVPLIARHPTQDFKTLRFAEPVATQSNPVTVVIDNMSEEEGGRTVQFLADLCYQPKNLSIHQWSKGDLLFADNHTLIHGRREFLDCSPRHLQRIQLK